MKRMTSIFAALILSLPVLNVSAATQKANFSVPTFEHGGGCRKSSPQGQCCHMDNRTGTVHCH
jgi:hypothetical protein